MNYVREADRRLRYQISGYPEFYLFSLCLVPDRLGRLDGDNG